MSKSIKHTFTYSHSPEAVWDYLTKPELIAQWLMPSDFKPTVGHQFNFTTKPMPQFGFNGIVYCKVLEVEPFKKLVYSWKGGPGDGAEFTLDSVVTWVIKPLAKGCEVQFEHSGFKDDNIIGFNMMNEGWSKNGQRIETLLNTVKA